MTKVLMRAETRLLAAPAKVTPFRSVELNLLSNLMVDAYRGTTDWEEGDDESVAQLEIEATLAGEYGPFKDLASGVICDEGGSPVAAVAVSEFEGEPTILFVFTAKAAAGRGLATALIRNAAHELMLEGLAEISLYVSHDNPAINLYRKLGFESLD